jgi:hypothetical protein
MDKKGVAIPPGHPDYTSAEETTNEVTVEGGYGTLLVPVNTKHNTSSHSPLSLSLLPPTSPYRASLLAQKHKLTSNR